MQPAHVLAVILARAGSRGLPRKNILPIAGRPMIAWTIEAAKAARRLDAICVTTDLAEAAALAREAGLLTIGRPAALATDHATVDAAARHAVLAYQSAGVSVTHVVLLYANVPLRAPGIIDAAVTKLLATGADSVRSVAAVGKHHPDWMHRLEGDRLIQFRPNSFYRRQDLEPLYYHDGAVVAVTRDSLFHEDPADPHAFFGADRRAVVAQWPAVDVDTPEDAALATARLQSLPEPDTQASMPAQPIATLGAAGTGGDASSYIIAEIGVNHDGRAATALALIDAARAAGADAVKFQVFSADRLAGASAATCAYQRRGADADATQREMLRRLELSRDTLTALRRHCAESGIDFIATPFGLEELDFIAHALDPVAIKIASPDLVNAPLLSAAVATGHRLIVSTGASDWTEIEDAIATLAPAIREDRLALLHCISAYPTPAERVQLSTIAALRQAFHVPVGFSDHTTEIDMGALAVAAGACILEKHLTHDTGAVGPDHAASLEPDAFRHYVDFARRAAHMMGSPRRVCLDIEQDVRAQARGRLVLRRAVPAGARITADALAVQRPGDGIAPREFERIVGCFAARALAADTVLEWEMIDEWPSGGGTGGRRVS